MVVRAVIRDPGRAQARAVSSFGVGVGVDQTCQTFKRLIGCFGRIAFCDKLGAIGEPNKGELLGTARRSSLEAVARQDCGFEGELLGECLLLFRRWRLSGFIVVDRKAAGIEQVDTIGVCGQRCFAQGRWEARDAAPLQSDCASFGGARLLAADKAVANRGGAGGPYGMERRFALEQRKFIGGDAGFDRLVARVLAQVEQPEAAFNLPLDIEATAFQARVWQALRKIPLGSTASYAEIARQIGAPRASRAVAGACAANPVALAVPCHRVVRTGGALSGYRWGVDRKKTLLEREAPASDSDAS